VISADQIVTPVRAQETFVAPVDGVFMSESLYQRTRRAVADRIQELHSK
jgi:hypothetical protein